MVLARELSLCALAAYVSLSLQGCSLLPSKDTTTTTAMMTTTSTSTITETVTVTVPTTSTSSSGTNGTGSLHCKSVDDSHSCKECEDGFDLKAGECFYNCLTNKPPIKVAQGAKKGLCLDDTTFQYCADEIPHVWPNTKEPVQSIRLFSSWQGFWPGEGREQAWKNLVNVVKKNNLQVFMGTQITCNETDDDRDWKQVLALMKELGPEHLTALAIGNEIELLFYKPYASRDCIASMWKGGYFWRKTQDRVKDLDAMGADFAKIPVTSVFGAMILGGEPFFETENAMCTTYLRNATAAYGQRWIYTLNVYPYLDPSVNVDEPGSHKCDKAIQQCTCLDEQRCLTISILTAMRRKMKEVTKTEETLLWVGETGWSAPQAATLASKVAACPDFSSNTTFETNYRNFLTWDLNITANNAVRGPDHIFYFTMRDSVNFGYGEHFGLVGQCGDTQCKLQDTKDATEGVFETELLY